MKKTHNLEKQAKRLREKARQLNLKADRLRRKADNLWGSHILRVLYTDLQLPVKTAEAPAKIHRICEALHGVRAFLNDPKEIARLDRILQLDPFPNGCSRRYGNPEIKKIMRQRGVTRQRAHQILKKRNAEQAAGVARTPQQP